MKRRGPYAKGIAKRQEILRVALDVIAAHGINGTSIKELAAAVDLSQAGLLHYFNSKEDLFLQILRARDEADSQQFMGVAQEDVAAEDPDVATLYARYFAGHPELVLVAYLRLAEHNASVPGLVELFSRMSVEAADPASPARAYFAERNTLMRTAFTAVLTELQEQGRVDPQADPELLARALQAVSDVLQLQSLADPDLDISHAIEQVLRLLVPGLDLSGSPLAQEAPYDATPSDAE